MVDLWDLSLNWPIYRVLSQFTLVSKYAFSQAPSHLETTLAGSEEDSTTGD